MHVLSRLVLAVVLLSLTPASAQPSKKPSPAVQAEFNGFIARFRAALRANDRGTVAGMTRLPFETYRDAAEFRAKGYPAIFTARNRSCLQREKALYDRDGLGNDYYVIFCGDLGFIFAKTPTGFLFTEIGSND